LNIGNRREPRFVLSVLFKPATLNKFTTDSRNWITTALDPFHDTGLELAGIPDQHCESSVVRCYRSVETITVPSSVTSGDKWNCVVTTLPFFGDADLLKTTFSSGYIWNYKTSNPQDAGHFNIVTALRGPASADDMYRAGTTNAFDYRDNIAIGPDAISDYIPARIVAGGFEVHNVTPELYKGGSVTCTSIGTLSKTTQSINSASSDYCVANYSKAPLAGQGTAAQDPYATSWDAAEGCYVPFRIALDDTDYQLANGNMRLLNSNTQGLSSDFDATYASTGHLLIANPTRSANIELSSAYFTGLPYETVLKITTKVFVETAPVTTLSELALASKPAHYDPAALELYRNVVCDAPVAVPVKMNAHGDFWRILKNIIGIAAPVLSVAIPGIGGAIGSAAQGLVAVGDNIMEMKKAKRKDQQPIKNIKIDVNGKPVDMTGFAPGRSQTSGRNRGKRKRQKQNAPVSSNFATGGNPMAMVPYKKR
jgi:hypothetical protein